jgi:hypothetical protein
MSMIDNIKYSPNLDYYKVSGIRKHQCSYNIIIGEEISHFVHHKTENKLWFHEELRNILNVLVQSQHQHYTKRELALILEHGR